MTGPTDSGFCGLLGGYHPTRRSPRTGRLNVSKPTEDNQNPDAVPDARLDHDGNPESFVGINEPDDALDAEETGAEARTNSEWRRGR